VGTVVCSTASKCQFLRSERASSSTKRFESGTRGRFLIERYSLRTAGVAPELDDDSIAEICL
jgi:hypothetical protein